MRAPLSILFCFLAFPAFAQNPSPSKPSPPNPSQRPKFVPGDLIVGYKSVDDKNAALEEFKSQNSSARGLDEGGGVKVEDLSGAALKLHFDAPESSARGLEEGDQSDLTKLQDMAKDLKANDKRVKYAHPNWIMKFDPIENRPHNVKAEMRASQVNSIQRTEKRTAGPNDPIFAMGMQWNLQPPPMGMNAVGAWRHLANSKLPQGKKIVVAVLDSGIIREQPDIAEQGHLLDGYNFVSHDLCEFKIVPRDADVDDTGNYCGDPNSGSSWHGTHVAGIIGAAGTNNGEGIASIAWNIGVLPIRVIGSGGGASDDIIDAIRWAAGLHIDGVPDNATPADVINMSLGGRAPCDEENFAGLISAIADARNAGTVIVVSAGNGAFVTDDGEECNPAAGYDACKFRPEDVKGYEPAGCPGVISVAASDPKGHISFYSNYGDVTIMAPGGDEGMSAEFPNGNGKTERPLGVWSTIKDGYGSMQGTSQAAPHVSAAIALALAAHPEWRRKPDLIEQKIRETASKPKPGSCPQETPCGPGQLDALALLKAR